MRLEYVTMDATNAVKVDQINENSFYKNLEQYNNSQAAVQAYNTYMRGL